MKVVQSAETIAVKVNDISIVIETSLIKNLFNRTNSVNEKGGILYGYKLFYISEYRITGFTDPYQRDYQSKFYFIRKDVKHFKDLKKEWKKNNYTMYLGDWHSHPIGGANPSSTDIETWINISKESTTNSEILIFCLVVKLEILFSIYNREGACIHEFIISKSDNSFSIKYKQ